jgi:hypothetical protein
MRCSSAYRVGAAHSTAEDQAMATGCWVACSCAVRQNFVVKVRNDLERAVGVRMTGNFVLGLLVEESSVHLPRYRPGSMCLPSHLDGLWFKTWLFRESCHLDRSNQPGTFVRCKDIGSEKVQLDPLVSSSLEHWFGRSLVGYEMSPETARSLPYTRVRSVYADVYMVSSRQSSLLQEAATAEVARH